MSDSQNKTRVIPITAWVIAIVTYLVSATAIFLFAMPTDPDMSRWPLGGGWPLLTASFCCWPASFC